jgi:hypothetical protein
MSWPLRLTGQLALLRFYWPLGTHRADWAAPLLSALWVAQAVEDFLTLAILHFGASVEDFAIANDRCGQTLFAKLVFAEQFEAVGFGSKYEAFTGFVPGVDPRADENGRGGEGAPESVSPKFFAA